MISKEECTPSARACVCEKIAPRTNPESLPGESALFSPSDARPFGASRVATGKSAGRPLKALVEEL